MSAAVLPLLRNHVLGGGLLLVSACDGRVPTLAGSSTSVLAGCLEVDGSGWERGRGERDRVHELVVLAPALSNEIDSRGLEGDGDASR